MKTPSSVLKQETIGPDISLTLKKIQLNQIWMFSIFGGEMKKKEVILTQLQQDWISRKITVQNLPITYTDGDQIVEYKFIIKDKAKYKLFQLE